MRSLMVRVVLVLIPIILVYQPIPLSIYDIQYTTDPSGNSPHVGDSVITTGIVTGIYGNNFFIEERPGGAWHGIYVYRSSTSQPALSLGDSVQVTGLVQEYNNMTEIKATASEAVIILVAGITLPDTTKITIPQLNTEDYEGSLVRIDSVYFVESGTFSSTAYHIVSTDDVDTGLVYIKSQTNIPGTPIPEGLCYLIGNVAQWYEDMELWPRMVDDIVTGVKESYSFAGNIKPFIQFSPNPLKGVVSFSLSLPEDGFVELKVYDVLGRTVKTVLSGVKQAGTHTIEWSGRDNSGQLLPSGIYFVRMKTSRFNITKRLVILR